MSYFLSPRVFSENIVKLKLEQTCQFNKKVSFTILMQTVSHIRYILSDILFLFESMQPCVMVFVDIYCDILTSGI